MQSFSHFYIGGQALIEGIMMRGIDKEAIVIRTPEAFLYEKNKN